MGASEPFAIANKRQARSNVSDKAAAHTMSAHLSMPPEVIVGQPTTTATAPWLAVTATPTAPGASTSLEQQRILPAENVVRLPDPTPLDYTFDVRQQWEGVVTSIGVDEFSVVLRDILRVDTPEYEALLPTEEISEDDLPLLKEGAVLYWTIGYKQNRTGTRERVSAIRLRRLPAWSRADIERVRKEAHELDELFKVE